MRRVQCRIEFYPKIAAASPAWSATTSTQDSRLFGHILPLFKAKTGVDVKVVAQGTGQASIRGAAETQTLCSSTPFGNLKKRRSEEVRCNALDSSRSMRTGGTFSPFSQCMGALQVHSVYGDPRHDEVRAQHAVQQRTGVDKRHAVGQHGLCLVPADPARVLRGRSNRLTAMTPSTISRDELRKMLEALHDTAAARGEIDIVVQCRGSWKNWTGGEITPPHPEEMIAKLRQTYILLSPAATMKPMVRRGANDLTAPVGRL